MTREDIIRMAREAGYQPLNPDVIFDCLKEVFFERFAELVAAAEREQMQADGWRQCAVGQKTTQFCGITEQAVAAERERCAQLCESYGMPDGTSETALALAAAIRGMK